MKDETWQKPKARSSKSTHPRPTNRELSIRGHSTDCIHGHRCNKFGIHRNMPAIRQLYEDGDLLWIANMGERELLQCFGS